uniref:Protein farnesyltransferase subunit beta n=1 Tax=Ditylenchus dipsaci TaxID=166011 RepID=A0A915EPE8_9BILA
MNLFPQLIPEKYLAMLSKFNPDELLLFDPTVNLPENERKVAIRTLGDYLSEKRTECAQLIALHYKDFKEEKKQNLLPTRTLKKQEAILELVDTVLLKCYLMTKPMLVSSLLRLPDNSCLISEAEKDLYPKEKSLELLILYERKKMHKKSLELLKKESKKEHSPLFGVERMSEYLQGLSSENSRLIFEYAPIVLAESVQLGVQIFTANEGDQSRNLDREEVLHFLRKHCIRAIIPYLEHIIYKCHEQRPKFHEELAEHLVLSIKILMKDYVHALADEELRTAAGREEGELGELRKKLMNFLETSKDYSPERILLQLDENLLEERAIIYGRLKRHDEALSIYSNILLDYAGAEHYCSTYFDPNDEVNSKVFFMLFKAYACPPPEESSNSHEKHAGQIDTVQAISLIPLETPLNRVWEALEAVFEAIKNKATQSSLLLSIIQLARKNYEKKLQKTRNQKIIIDSTVECCVCKNKIIDGAFYVFNWWVITSKLKRKKKRKVTERTCAESYESSKTVLDYFDSYDSMVEKNSIFADKSSFAKYLANCGSHQLFIFPKCFMKTLNATMAHFLLQVRFGADGSRIDPLQDPVLQNYAAKFPKMAILKQTKFMQTQLGRRGSIYISFDGCNYKDHLGFLTFVRNVVSDCYKNMKSLENAMYKISNESTAPAQLARMQSNIKTFTKFREGEVDQVNEIDLQFSMKRLAQIIQDITESNQEIILLVDDFDVPLTHCLTTNMCDQQTKDIKAWMECFITTSMQQCRVVMFGQYFIRLSPFSNKFEKSSLLTSTGLEKFFLITQHDFENLCDYFDVDQSTREVLTEWIGGYLLKKTVSMDRKACSVDPDLAYHPKHLIEFLKDHRALLAPQHRTDLSFSSHSSQNKTTNEEELECNQEVAEGEEIAGTHMREMRLTQNKDTVQALSDSELSLSLDKDVNEEEEEDEEEQENKDAMSKVFAVPESIQRRDHSFPSDGVFGAAGPEWSDTVILSRVTRPKREKEKKNVICMETPFTLRHFEDLKKATTNIMQTRFDQCFMDLLGSYMLAAGYLVAVGRAEIPRNYGGIRKNTSAYYVRIANNLHGRAILQSLKEYQLKLLKDNGKESVLASESILNLITTFRYIMEHIIYKCHEQIPKFHEELAEYLVLSIKILMKDYVHALADEELRTAAGQEEGELGELRKKLTHFLETSKDYSPERVLLQLDENLLEERAIVYGRLKRHDEALSIYSNILLDYAGAERYCATYFDPNDEVNSRVFFMLFKAYSCPPPDEYSAISLLVQAISLIPMETPLNRVWEALEAVFEAIKNKATQSSLLLSIIQLARKNYEKKLQKTQQIFKQRTFENPIMSHGDADFKLADCKMSFDDEGASSYTSVEQKRTEGLISAEQKWYQKAVTKEFADNDEPFVEHPKLCRELHVEYVIANLKQLSRSYMSMDASRSWFCFWGLHSLRMLGHKLDKDFQTKLIAFLKSCEASGGGYAGGPGQLPHLATTYASVMALISIGTPEAFASIDRKKLYAFISSMRLPNGSFQLHDGGEVDVRGAYCAIAAACVTGISDDLLFENTPSWIMRCQTYEGGFGGEPNCEAHGGYTCCAIAGLALLRKSHLVNTEGALRWLVNRQMQYEGGFNGRTNKLVDGCYSYWQSASFFTLEYEITNHTKQCPTRGLLNQEALQKYVLIVAQDIRKGGLRDKPDKSPDLYHTCYSLAGLSIAQSYASSKDLIVGGQSNALEDVHPLFNVCMNVETLAKQYFVDHPVAQ